MSPCNEAAGAGKYVATGTRVCCAVAYAPSNYRAADHACQVELHTARAEVNFQNWRFLALSKTAAKMFSSGVDHTIGGVNE
jgi:hypothetical protein